MADIESLLRANHKNLDVERIKEYFELFGRGAELREILENTEDANL